MIQALVFYTNDNSIFEENKQTIWIEAVLSDSEATVSDLLPLTMTDYDQVPVSSLLENNGHAAKLSNTYQ